MLTSLPALQVRHTATADGNDWTVRATWDDGTFDEITGFHNEAEANDWIATEFQGWLEEVSKARTN